MIINTAGEYTLQYTATDACGNSTTVERDLTVLPPPRTVLYTDGTLIINERPQDIAANIQAHGAATNVYIPFDPNGDTDVKKYIFSSTAEIPWREQRSSIIKVEVGSEIQPTSTRVWFDDFMNCTSMDMSKLDTSLTDDMDNMFWGCAALTSLDLSNFNTSNVTDMHNMFSTCSSLVSLDLSNFDTSNVTDMKAMFKNCTSLTDIDLSSFDTGSVSNMKEMFYSCSLLTSLDLSNFNTNSVSDMSSMFYSCSSIITIYASLNFVVTQVTNSASMFSWCQNLVGGAGTTYTSYFNDKTYAKIDGGTSDPGYFTAKS